LIVREADFPLFPRRTRNPGSTREPSMGFPIAFPSRVFHLLPLLRALTTSCLGYPRALPSASGRHLCCSGRFFPPADCFLSFFFSANLRRRLAFLWPVMPPSGHRSRETVVLSKYDLLLSKTRLAQSSFPSPRLRGSFFPSLPLFFLCVRPRRMLPPSYPASTELFSPFAGKNLLPFFS